MPVYVRIEGIQYQIRDCENIKISEEFIILIEKIIEQLNAQIELNFILPGRIGYEAANDQRLKPLNNSIIENLNAYRGISFKNVGLMTDPLLDEFQEEKICYVALWSKNIDDLIITVLHELCHFFEPFECNIEAYSNVDGKTNLTREEYVQNEVRRILNERYSHFRAFSIYIELINEAYEIAEREKEVERCKKRIIEHIKELDKVFLKSLGELRGMNPNEFQTQHHADIKFFDILFKQIHYFLGGFDALEASNIDSENLNREWFQFIGKVKRNLIKDLEFFLSPTDYRDTLILFKIFNLDLLADFVINIEKIKIKIKTVFINILVDLKDLIEDYDQLRDSFEIDNFIGKFVKFVKSNTFLALTFLATKGFYNN
ncbi:MAG: hypothetical protein ACFFCI_11095 [Promethearchaeota archaeon]